MEMQSPDHNLTANLPPRLAALGLTPFGGHRVRRLVPSE